MCDMCSAHLPPHTDSVLHCKFIFSSFSPSISSGFVAFLICFQAQYADSTFALRAKRALLMLHPELHSIHHPPCSSIFTSISTRHGFFCPHHTII
jgi:hypothetical protein